MNARDGGKRRRHVITWPLKKEIIANHEKGVKISVLTKIYGFSQSTISTIIKGKSMVKKRNVTEAFKIRSIVIEMEKRLLTWIKEKRIQGEILNEELIRQKARSIYDGLRAETSSTSNYVYDFKASKGWFRHFEKRATQQCDIKTEPCQSNEPISDFKQEFLDYVESEDYSPQQVFNINETGLFWKRMPRRTFIAKDEAKLPGHKSMKDRLKLLFGGNASGDFKLKPLLVYHSETPRVFKQHKIVRSNLGVCWKSNKRVRVTKVIFNEWIHDVFCPSVQAYLERHDLPKRVLLLLDNTPGHDADLAMILETKFDFIKVKFIPPNTDLLLRPMNQKVIPNFKKLYTKRMFMRCLDATFTENGTSLGEFWQHHFSILDAIRLIINSWNDIPTFTMNSAWGNLWPQVVCAFEGIQETKSVEKDIVELGLSMGLEVDEYDIQELVAGHSQELSAEELSALQEMLTQEQKSDDEKDDDGPDVSTEVLKAGLKGWNAVKALLQYHPEVEECEIMSCQFEDRVLSYFRKLLLNQRQKNQLYFVNTSVSDCPSSATRRCQTIPSDNTKVLMEYNSVGGEQSVVYPEQLYIQPLMHHTFYNNKGIQG